MPPKIRQEATVSSRGLVAWLMHLALERRSTEDRSQAMAMLEAFLSLTLPLSDLSPSLSDDDFTQASCESDADDHCIHVSEDIERLIKPFRAEWTWEKLVICLVEFSASKDCPAIGNAIAYVLREVETLFDANVPSKGFELDRSIPDYLRGAKGKRRRVDEDFKDLVVCVLPKQTRTRSAFTFLKSQCEVSPSVTAAWEQEYAAQQLCATRRSLTCSGVVSVQEDASKTGAPKEDTQLHLLWDAACDIGCIPTFMVYMQREHFMSSLTCFKLCVVKATEM